MQAAEEMAAIGKGGQEESRADEGMERNQMKNAM